MMAELLQVKPTRRQRLKLHKAEQILDGWSIKIMIKLQKEEHSFTISQRKKNPQLIFLLSSLLYEVNAARVSALLLGHSFS